MSVQLLVSVRDAAEASAALVGGAHLIDVKEPARGALGAADPAEWHAIAAVAAGQRPLSIALGELSESSPAQLAALAGQVPRSAKFAKLGLAGCDGDPAWRDKWLTVMRALPPGVGSVAVVYADHLSAAAPEPQAISALQEIAPLSAVLIDTQDKSRGGLFEHWPFSELRGFCSAVRRLGLPLALAGSLQARDFSQALLLDPTWLAVRAAACEGARTSAVSAARVARLLQAIRAAEQLSRDSIANSAQLLTPPRAAS